jgi:hypothetical protein
VDNPDKAHPPVATVAQRGIEHVLAQLHLSHWDDTELGRAGVTGPVAAATIQPLTVGGQLMIHIESDGEARLATIRRHLSLLPTDPANVRSLWWHLPGVRRSFGRELVVAGPSDRHDLEDAPRG